MKMRIVRTFYKHYRTKRDASPEQKIPDLKGSFTLWESDVVTQSVPSRQGFPAGPNPEAQLRIKIR